MTPEQLGRLQAAALADPACLDAYEELQRLQSLTETQAEQIKGLELQKGGHGEPCYYCGKACISISGNPAKWPIPLCHPDEPGVVKFHHVGCVSERLEQLASTRALKKSKESKV